MTMQGMGPMAPYTDYNIRGVALLAPCPDVAISSYLDTYSGMAPLQVIYGSRDQDGCVAYGQSIAIFEPEAARVTSSTSRAAAATASPTRAACKTPPSRVRTTR